MDKPVNLIVVIIGLLLQFDTLSQGVAINNDNSNPDAIARLDMKCKLV